jgi:EAL domain-containing protein (putative c-di-GMP-specific phosphodiesterase class I)
MTDRPRILIVEDEAGLRTVLDRAGRKLFSVVIVGDGNEAADLLTHEAFDVVLSDVMLPGMSGLDLLRIARAYDLDVPFILMTGHAEGRKAKTEAIELGVLTFIEKPFDIPTLMKTLERTARLSRIGRVRRWAADAGIGSPLPSDGAGLAACFDRALFELFVAYQPIARAMTGETVGYEALARTAEPCMSSPMAFVEAAEKLGRTADFGRAVRELAALGVEAIPGDLYVNLHPMDLADDALFDPSAPLSKIASRVVLEVTERAGLHAVPDLVERIARLRGMGFRIALDDMGAGYAGLSAFAALEPDVVKLDMSLIRGIDSSPVKARIVEAFGKLARELGMQVVAEGIETGSELTAVVDLGVDLVQGFLLGRPDPKPTPASTWSRPPS